MPVIVDVNAIIVEFINITNALEPNSNAQATAVQDANRQELQKAYIAYDKFLVSAETLLILIPWLYDNEIEIDLSIMKSIRCMGSVLRWINTLINVASNDANPQARIDLSTNVAHKNQQYLLDISRHRRAVEKNDLNELLISVHNLQRNDFTIDIDALEASIQEKITTQQIDPDTEIKLTRTTQYYFIMKPIELNVAFKPNQISGFIRHCLSWLTHFQALPLPQYINLTTDISHHVGTEAKAHSPHPISSSKPIPNSRATDVDLHAHSPAIASQTPSKPSMPVQFIETFALPSAALLKPTPGKRTPLLESTHSNNTSTPSSYPRSAPITVPNTTLNSAPNSAPNSASSSAPNSISSSTSTPGLRASTHSSGGSPLSYTPGNSAFRLFKKTPEANIVDNHQRVDGDHHEVGVDELSRSIHDIIIDNDATLHSEQIDGWVNILEDLVFTADQVVTLTECEKFMCDHFGKIYNTLYAKDLIKDPTSNMKRKRLFTDAEINLDIIRDTAVADPKSRTARIYYAFTAASALPAETDPQVDIFWRLHQLYNATSSAISSFLGIYSPSPAPTHARHLMSMRAIKDYAYANPTSLTAEIVKQFFTPANKTAQTDCQKTASATSAWRFGF